MANGFIPAVQRFSQFLGQERELQRRRRTERILTQLPDLIQKEFSGITTEKEVYSKLPQITGKLYAYGPEVGQMATQIATTIAQTKLNELQAGRLEKQRGEQKDALIDAFGDVPIRYQGKDTTFGEVAKNFNYDPETLTKIAPSLINANRITPRVEVGKTEGKGIYAQVYTGSEQYGWKPQKRYDVDPLTGLADDPETQDIKETESFPEVTKFLEQERLREEQRKAARDLRYITAQTKTPILKNVKFKDGTLGTVEVKQGKQGTYFETLDTRKDVTKNVERVIGSGIYENIGKVTATELTQLGKQRGQALGEAGNVLEKNVQNFSQYFPKDLLDRDLPPKDWDGQTRESVGSAVYEGIVDQIKNKIDFELYQKLITETATEEDIEKLADITESGFLGIGSSEIIGATQIEFLKKWLKFRKARALEEYKQQQFNLEQNLIMGDQPQLPANTGNKFYDFD